MWMYGCRKLPVLEGARPVEISTAEIAEHALACNICMENIFENLDRRERKWLPNTLPTERKKVSFIE
jgi:hypothetical protein